MKKDYQKVDIFNKIVQLYSTVANLQFHKSRMSCDLNKYGYMGKYSVIGADMKKDTNQVC